MPMLEIFYTLDADLVVIATGLRGLAARLREQGFTIEEHEHSLNAQGAGSELRIQFTTDPRYQAFPDRAVEAVVLGIPVRVACLEDTTAKEALGLCRSLAPIQQEKERRVGFDPTC